MVAGATPLPDDDTCPYGEDYWYERTAYRKIPYSTCEGGIRPDQGTKHLCPGLKGHGFFFWLFVLFLPIALASLVGYWFYRRSGLARGYASSTWCLVPFSDRFPFLGQFVCLDPISDLRIRNPALSIHWRLFLGSLSALSVSHGRSLLRIYRSLGASARAEATERSRLMRMLKYYALQMRIDHIISMRIAWDGVEEDVVSRLR